MAKRRPQSSKPKTRSQRIAAVNRAIKEVAPGTMPSESQQEQMLAQLSDSDLGKMFPDSDSSAGPSAFTEFPGQSDVQFRKFLSEEDTPSPADASTAPSSLQVQFQGEGNAVDSASSTSGASGASGGADYPAWVRELFERLDDLPNKFVDRFQQEG